MFIHWRKKHWQMLRQYMTAVAEKSCTHECVYARIFFIGCLLDLSCFCFKLCLNSVVIKHFLYMCTDKNLNGSPLEWNSFYVKPWLAESYNNLIICICTFSIGNLSKASPLVNNLYHQWLFVTHIHISTQKNVAVDSNLTFSNQNCHYTL